jgi:small multidrug resistance pump
MLFGSVAFQLVGAYLLPLTKGLTAVFPTLAAFASFVIGIGLLSIITNRGVELGILIPLISAVIPLCVVFIGIFFYGENGSVVKIGMLALACGLIGFASQIKA